MKWKNVYILYYMENRIYTKYSPKGSVYSPLRYDLESGEKNIDYSLVKRADVYILSELEEYTYVIAMLLAKKYPHKTILILDKKVSYFPELAARTIYIESSEKDLENIYIRFYRKHCLWIISEGVNYFPFGHFIDIYNSMNVLYSMTWCQKIEGFGDKNQDYTVYLVDFLGGPNGRAGLVDYMRYVYAHYLVAKRHGWKFCVDLSRQPNQYLMAEGENMWDYYFEPLSDIPREEAYECFSVIRAYENGIRMHSAPILPYMRGIYSDNNKEAMKTVRFNKKTKEKINELMPEILKRDNYVLGVILRGTDYRKEANEYRQRGVKVASLEKMIAKCKFIIELYGYTHIFLATEDLEYFQKVKGEFGDRCLSIDQKRRYHDYSSEYKTCADVLEIENGKEFGRTYLAVIQSLANCRSLIANMNCGATWAAEGLNNSKYEYFEVVSP